MDILLNDILQFSNQSIVKLRFNRSFGGGKEVIECLDDKSAMLKGQYWNYEKKGNFSVGNITLGFVSIPSRKDYWLLFHVGRVTKDLNIRNGVGYEYEDIPECQKFVDRLIIKFENHSQNLIRLGSTTLQECVVKEILQDRYDNDYFPGYANVNVSWISLENLIHKSSWRTALQNQKGVYLIVDHHTGKQYVGSASGKEMLLGRWESYIKTCHGGNKLLERLDPNYIKKHFYFSILETFNHNIEDQIILDRESFWKDVLQTRRYGYNDN